MSPPPSSYSFFFFNDTATTEIYTLSLHDALPIFKNSFNQDQINAAVHQTLQLFCIGIHHFIKGHCPEDRKSTRLNSSHSQISYAVFCLKKKKKLKTLSALHIHVT